MQYRKIEEFPNYWIDEEATVYRAAEVLKENVVYQNQGGFKPIKTYWSNYDTALLVKFTKDGKQYIRRVAKVMYIAFFEHVPGGDTVVCKDGDFRNCTYGNLKVASKLYANIFKNRMYGDNRLNDFYDLFLRNPTEEKYYSLPIDIQESIYEKGVVEWEPRMSVYRKSYI